MVSGVAQVQVYGSKYAVRVQLNPDVLVARGIGVDEVQAAIQRANVNLPTGTLYGSKQSFTVQSNGQLFNAAAFRPLIVAYRNGNPCAWKIWAGSSIASRTTKHQLVQDTESIVLGIQRQPGTNTIEVVDGIRKLLPQFRSQIPASVSLSDFIRPVAVHPRVHLRRQIHAAADRLPGRNGHLPVPAEHLGDAIPSLAVPLAIIAHSRPCICSATRRQPVADGAHALGRFRRGYAIVMLENIVRHMELGESRMEASLRGSREIGFTIVSMTLSLVAVFIPVLFLGGIVGRLLHEFAVTISVAILVSGFVSLSLTPMLCSRFLKPPKEKHGAIYMAFERFFDGMTNLYDRTLKVVLRHRLATVTFSFVLLGATGYLFYVLPKGFIPSYDAGSCSA